MAAKSRTHHEVSDCHGQQEEGNALPIIDAHAVPHRLDPLATEDAEDHHEGMCEIDHVPSRQVALVLGVERFILEVVVLLAKQLHADNREDEDDDGEDHNEVAECAQRSPNDGEEQVHGFPRFGQFEDAELRVTKRREETSASQHTKKMSSLSISVTFRRIFRST